MYKYLKSKSTLIGLFVTSLLVVIFTTLIGLPLIRTHIRFDVSNLNFEGYDLFDLGVADINLDGRIDAFTLNHSARQSVAINGGENKFTEALTSLGLDQDSKFPGLEDTLQEKELTKPGLYIYRHKRDLYFQSNQLRKSVSGKLNLSWPIEVSKTTDTEFDIKTKPLTSGGLESTIDFKINPNGLIALKGKEDIIELTHNISLDATLPATQIFVGFEQKNPKTNQFELMWRDRHSFAWTDLNRDKKMDVFITRGGVKGQLDKVSDPVKDEMMLMTESKFQNKVEQLKFEKNDCPGRQTAWVDFDGDNLLELYVGCGRDSEPTYPNLLYQQQPNGTFINIAPRLGIDFPEDGAFRWLDDDDDGDMDLLVVRDRSIWLYVQESGKFSPLLISDNLPNKIINFLISDFDSDGDLDVYAASKHTEESNLLLLNEQGSYQVIDPTEIGLPNQGVGASWVDYDNDGLCDFYIAPYGLYRQTKNRHFKATGLIDKHWHTAKLVDARSAWVDLDNDGYRDLLTVTKQTPPLHIRLLNQLPKVNFNRNWKLSWLTQLHHNNFRANHWLEIDLSAHSGNAQAIGAKVTVETDRGLQTQTVGEAESSYFSQGHYRLYFGLGEYTKIKSVEVSWLDGQTQQIGNNITADQLLQYERIDVANSAI